jgi:phosphoribosylformylglycinamidine cyclo-ligase
VSEITYRASGVNIDAGNEAVRRIRSLARSTFTPGVLSDIGSFGGLFQLEPGRYREPVLVASADGVGTKLKVAFLANRHDTVGIDLVNHCVNDILVQGAEPLFFLDYLATGQLSPDVTQAIVGGMAGACRDNGCALLGGETAEMPGFYGDGEYDLAGFIVGVVDRERVVSGRSITAGDVLVGVPSSGLHTNGYSLARRIVFERLGLGVDAYVPELGRTAGEALLEPHRSYLPLVRPLLGGGRIKGMAHITGGGITENLPRILPHGTAAVVDVASWQVPALFRWLQEAGRVPFDDMMRTFNMGIGLVIVTARERSEALIEELAARGGRESRVIGEIVPGEPPAVTYANQP